jgi:hypothetical protein
MTVSFTRCWQKIQLEWLVGLVCACLLAWLPQAAHAEPPAVEIEQFRVDRVADGVFITGFVRFELPMAVESALLSGASLSFVAEAQVQRERWYWTDKTVISAQRHFRLSYQPVTRRWRLRISDGPIVGNGLGASREFDTLAEAMSGVQRLSRWKIGDIAELDPEQKHRIDFKFYLDLSQLALPFHIGVMGQTDWNISASTTQRLLPEASK